MKNIIAIIAVGVFILAGFKLQDEYNNLKSVREARKDECVQAAMGTINPKISGLDEDFWKKVNDCRVASASK